MTELNKFNELAALDVSKYVEKKNGLSYLSWAHAWRIFKEHYPDARYIIGKTDVIFNGVMVTTEVIAGGESHTMWLPVMDFKNKSISADATTTMDVNKAIMRCLVKNLAMFGLGLNLYAGEDIPFESTIPVVEEVKTKPAIEGDVSENLWDMYLKVKHLINPDFIPRVSEVLKLDKKTNKEAIEKMAAYFKELLKKV